MRSVGLGVIFIIHCLVVKVHSAYQPGLTQYLHIAALPQAPSPPRPSPTITTLSSPTITTLPSPPKSSPASKPAETIQPTALNSNVLNNLAIALQLLIVSNILNSPAEHFESLPNFEPLTRLESLAKFELAPKSALPVPITPLTVGYTPLSPIIESAKPISYPLSSIIEPIAKHQGLYCVDGLTNANFLGANTFADPIVTSLGPIRSSPRTSMMLMSPYEALGTNSDPISSYSSYTKKDFLSPYASILAAEGNRELFAVTDFF